MTDPVQALATPPSHPRRLVFLGTPAMAVPSLQALHAAGFDIALVVTGADKRRGRGSSLEPTPVKRAAVDLGIAVTDHIEDALETGSDLGVVVAYGRIIRRPVLEVLPMVNLHFSLLPRWRGAAPVERAILAGDATTGVDLMAVEEGLDTGGIFAEVVLQIGADETAGELRRRLTDAGSALLVESLERGIGEPRPQMGEPVYAAKLDNRDREIDWSFPAVEVHRLVRIGGAWTTFRGKRLKVWRSTFLPDMPDRDGTDTGQPVLLTAPAAGEIYGTVVGTGDGCIELVEVQPEGRARQPADSWQRGTRPHAGERFGA